MVVAAAWRDDKQAGHRFERIRRPQTINQQSLLPVAQEPQVGVGGLFYDVHHLPHQGVLQLQFRDLTTQGLDTGIVGVNRPMPGGRGFVTLSGVPVPGMQRGHASLQVCPALIVDHVEPFDGLLPPHATQHRFDCLRS